MKPTPPPNRTFPESPPKFPWWALLMVLLSAVLLTIGLSCA